MASFFFLRKITNKKQTSLISITEGLTQNEKKQVIFMVGCLITGKQDRGVNEQMSYGQQKPRH